MFMYSTSLETFFPRQRKFACSTVLTLKPFVKEKISELLNRFIDLLKKNLKKTRLRLIANSQLTL